MSSVLHIYEVLNCSFYSFKWLYGHSFHYISLNHYILVMRNICNRFSHGRGSCSSVGGSCSSVGRAGGLVIRRSPV